MDKNYKEGMSVFQMKSLQYRIISEHIDTVIFENCPFFYSTATMTGRNLYSPTARWTYDKNEHLFWEQDEELTRRVNAQKEELLYYICGPFNDARVHFGFYFRPILEGGLKSIYETAEKQKADATEDEKIFLNTVCDGLLTIKKIAEKFSNHAERLSREAKNEKLKKHYAEISDMASHIPWEKPRTFREALNVYLLMKEMIEALDGIGSNSFGRLDLDLYRFYEQDIKNGILTEETAYDLICQFLLCSDCRYDHDMKMVGGGDHEMENTYVIGGCDSNGAPVYNELTKLFIRATVEEKIIYPKMMCRYSSESPKEYLDSINKAIISGVSVMMYQNDEAVIASLHHEGRPLEECRDYIVSGCWDVLCNGVKKIDSAVYFNMLKPFEYSIHKLYDKMEKVGIEFLPLDDADSFEDVYRITIENIRRLMEERIRVTHEGGQIWNKVNVLPIYSSTLKNCLENRKDFTEGGAKYHDEKLSCFGLPDIVDSLLAIKTLCFDTKKYTLTELLDAVRNNWEGSEEMRIEAIRCHGWGDGNKDSCELAARFHRDLCEMASNIKNTTYGGKIFIGHVTYTEIRFWGERTLATPNGRKSGEYFAQGLTPSRLKKIPYASSVIESMASIDPATIPGNSVTNIILPAGKTDLGACEALLRAGAKTSMQSLQLNCFSKEQLLDAQKHPERYPDLIVRVTGFSAKFTSLSPQWQNEVLTRNFYEN